MQANLNAHLGSKLIAPQSNRKAWWRNGMCKTGQPHRWQAFIHDRTRGVNCPHDVGKAVCPCNDLAHNYPEVAAEWDWEANGEDTRDSNGKQPIQSGLEVWPLRAQLERQGV